MTKIEHDITNATLFIEIEGHKAYVRYSVKDNVLDIVSTFVPTQLGGRGIAAQLVEGCYHYAQSQGYKVKASCSYAAAWIEKNAKA